MDFLLGPQTQLTTLHGKRFPALAAVGGRRIEKRGQVRGIAPELLTRMRKRYRVLVLLALVIALVVPVGFALSIDSTPIATELVVHPGMLPGAVAAPALPWTVTGSAKLLAVGTLLIGLAAAVRKTTRA